jgi:hypothetical protein
VTEVDFGYTPHRFQLEIHERAERFTVVVAHRRFGKTYCAVTTLIHAGLSTKKAAGRFGYVAPFLKQAKRTSWDYVKQFSRKIPSADIHEGELSVSYPNGSKISLFGADNPDAMRGIYFDGVVLDEMADFRPDVWGAIIRPTLSDRKGWAMFIGTPKGVNPFSELYQFGLSGKESDWTSMMYRADETGLINEEELRSARVIMSDAQYRQEFLCDFTASADNTLITIDQASAAARKVMTEADIQGVPKLLGVDVARFGDDRSVIFKRQGLYAHDPIVFVGMNNMDLAARVVATINQFEPDAVFIDAGRGEGVIDRVRQLGYAVIEVNFGGKPADDSYANKRSEMWDDMAKWLTAGGRIPNDVNLKTDLCVPTYKFNAQNRFQLESKDDIKKRGMRSPDLADALALTFAFPVAPKSTTVRTRRPQQQEWNPFAEVDSARGTAYREYDPYR